MPQKGNEVSVLIRKPAARAHHSDPDSSPPCCWVVSLRRSSSICLSFCSIVSLITTCSSSRSSMMYSWPLLVSMLTMMDLIDGSHSTRTPVEGGLDWRWLRSLLDQKVAAVLTPYGSCGHGDKCQGSQSQGQ